MALDLQQLMHVAVDVIWMKLTSLRATCLMAKSIPIPADVFD